MDICQVSSFTEEVNLNIVKKNSKQRVHSLFVERENASFLKLYFSNVKLPQKSYVEFEYGNGFVQREFFDNNNSPLIIIPSQCVNIRVIFSKESNLDEGISILLNTVEHDGNNSKAIIGQDERKPYMCYEGTEMAEHALSSAVAKIGGWGSCSLIGSENHVLTNHHVVISDPELTSGEIWFNWFNESCSSTSPVTEPVRLKPGKVLKKGASSGDNDYALFTLDNFDYLNSNVKVLFGGLELRKNNPEKGEKIYIPQYGNGGLRPMYIGDTKNGEPAKILNIENNGNKITYNADSQGGSSGSPVISRDDNKLIGLHWGGGNVNVGVSAQNLNFQLGHFIENSNHSVIGLGKVSSTNLELTPISSFEKLIPLYLSEGSRIQPFDTVKIEGYDDYSIIQVEAIDLVTNEISPLIFKAGLVNDDYQTHLHGDITGDVFLRLYDFELEKKELIKFWVTFKISDDTHNIKNHVIRLVFDNYDPYDIPFDIESAEVLDFNLSQRKKNTINYVVKGSDYYGFVALHRDQGPMSLVWFEKGYSKVKALLKSASGDEVLVNLRGQRATDCSSSSMNTAAACASSYKYSKFILQYFPEDNQDIKLEDGVYEGLIPLQAQFWKSQESKNILVKVSLVSG